jgi:hypothetical protein
MTEAIRHLGRPAREILVPVDAIASSFQANEDSLGGRRALCLGAGVDPSDRWAGFLVDLFFLVTGDPWLCYPSIAVPREGLPIGRPWCRWRKDDLRV